MDFTEELEEKFREVGLKLSQEQVEQFTIYYNLLIEWNEKINLTAIRTQSEIIEKHFLDCILPFKKLDLPENLLFADIGTGAGFPSIPWMIYKSEYKGVLIESVGKKVLFLKEVIKNLGFEERTEILNERAEILGLNPCYRESFDLVTARAVTNMYILSELALPLVKEDGIFVALKGPNVKEELEDSMKQIEILGGFLEEEGNYYLPNGDKRTILFVKKEFDTPKTYPRSMAQIKKTYNKKH